MTTIELHTTIDAPIEMVFDLARSIDFHIQSASKTYEKVIAGRTSGHISLGETVAWRGKHFGIFLKHTSEISEFDSPHKFTDRMIEGNFKHFEHEHLFDSKGWQTTMIDRLSYVPPMSFFGTIFDYFFLKRHLTHFLKYRNKAIKKEAEKARQSC
jgi:ligand-binding SRPBCC domain-containing protein